MTTESTSKANPATEKIIVVKNPLAAVKKTSPSSAAGKVAAKAVPTAKTPMPKQAEKKDKQKKIKMVRDSFSLTEDDYAKLLEMKKKCIAAGVPVKKSELLRVGLMELAKLSNASLLAIVKKIVIVKKG